MPYRVLLVLLFSPHSKMEASCDTDFSTTSLFTERLKALSTSSLYFSVTEDEGG